MILISHRGNTQGPDHENENRPEYIKNSLSLGFDVEIDVWCMGNRIFLGHDGPQYEVNKDFFQERADRLWVHTKNFEALSYMKTQLPQLKYFWHQCDRYTLVSNSVIWAHPGEELNADTVCVLPEKHALLKRDILGCYGVCSDYIADFM